VVFFFPQKRHPDSTENSGVNQLSYLPAGQFQNEGGKYMIVGNKPILKWSDIKMSELDLTKLISHFAQTNKAEGKYPNPSKEGGGFTGLKSDW
jgi:hypothetical protein